MDRVESSVRTLRVIQIALLLCIFFYGGIAELVMSTHMPVAHRNVSLLQVIFLFLTIPTVGILLLARKAMIEPALNKIRRTPDDAASLDRWKAANLLILAACESIALYGFILRMLGGTAEQAGLFYLIGMILLLIFTPRRP